MRYNKSTGCRSRIRIFFARAFVLTVYFYIRVLVLQWRTILFFFIGISDAFLNLS